MGVRYRNATPGTIAVLAATALLAVVSFNTPLLKSLNFLKATFSSGQYSGEITLGTLGFCHTLDGTSSCTGPRVGYEFDPNDVFGVTLFDIPEAITKYLTYVLILHVVALAISAIALILGLLAFSPTFPGFCLPITFASIATFVTFLALVFDLAMFYIAKARINNVSGASAEIGICVWLTLAAFIILSLSGCFFGVGGCCKSCRDEDNINRKKYKKQNDQEDNDYNMRKIAREDELNRQRNQQKEQDLPSFQPYIRENNDEDKYLIEPQNQPQQQQQLRRDGSVLQGVGMGYGRKTSKSPSNDPYANPYNNQNGYNQQYGNGYNNIAAPPPVARRLSDATNAGDFVGVGAGGAGVDRPQPPRQQQYGGQDYYNDPYGNGSDQGHNAGYGQEHDQNYSNDPYQQQNNYNDPYLQHNQQPNYQNDQYNHQTSTYPPQDQYNQYAAEPYRSGSTQPYANQPTPAPITMPTPGFQSARSPQPQGEANYDNSFGSSESHYPNPGAQANNADAYDGYDDGLGAIGMAVTQGNNNTGRHERDYTGQTFGVNDTSNGYQSGGGYNDNQFQPSSSSYNNNLHQPAPQHLINSNSQNNLLRSPVSPINHNDQRTQIIGNSGGYSNNQYNEPDQSSIRPPSYSAGDYAAGGSSSAVRGNEKSQYR
ncbi:uncharacterized protein L201_005732 [Kwoniella dendrophila CBS 6074]|uniref:Pali-domain-containing protein n=1 Tax=Kwoniella dendrophila CBS 6074 TaxID=1295534 RepID=A0AAX4K1T3_9TREE